MLRMVPIEVRWIVPSPHDMPTTQGPVANWTSPDQPLKLVRPVLQLFRELETWWNESRIAWTAAKRS
ncbi:MAG TPA: hypothetical protein DCE43_00550 [Planctomycetaceae bacterium]|nr:hypothetical protein [Planctomycetaceae bacterium]